MSLLSPAKACEFTFLDESVVVESVKKSHGGQSPPLFLGDQHGLVGILFGCFTLEVALTLPS